LSTPAPSRLGALAPAGNFGDDGAMVLGAFLVLVGVVLAVSGVRLATERPRPANLGGMLLAPAGLLLALLGAARLVAPALGSYRLPAPIRIVTGGDATGRPTVPKNRTPIARSSQVRKRPQS
jgi:hypothetical protein